MYYINSNLHGLGAKPLSPSVVYYRAFTPIFLTPPVP